MSQGGSSFRETGCLLMLIVVYISLTWSIKWSSLTLYSERWGWHHLMPAVLSAMFVILLSEFSLSLFVSFSFHLQRNFSTHVIEMGKEKKKTRDKGTILLSAKGSHEYDESVRMWLCDQLWMKTTLLLIFYWTLLTIAPSVHKSVDLPTLST